MCIIPLAVLLADAATLGGKVGIDALVRTRLADIALGCVVGLLAGACLRGPSLRATVSRPLAPRRLR